ncbi:endonuclease domain-containing protein [Nakamurella antarctica]|nr:DUF559 domain-containing protein [Nakamurella antarctica]
MDLDATIATLLSRQDGVISRQQATYWGMSDHQVDSRVQRREWVRLLPGVFRSAAHDDTAASRTRAAFYWVGKRGALSGSSAAWWWKVIEAPPARVEMTIPHRVQLRAQPGVQLRRRNLHSSDLVHHRGLRITSKPLTVLLTALEVGSSVLDRALQNGTPLQGLRATVDRNSGITGSPAMRKLLAQASDGAAATSERLFIKIMRGSGICGWKANTRLRVQGRDYEADFVFATARLIVEIDGWAWHHQPDRFQQDRDKQNALTLAGWIVLRFTWHDLTERPEWVAAQVGQAVGR